MSDSNWNKYFVRPRINTGFTSPRMRHTQPERRQVFIVSAEDPLRWESAVAVPREVSAAGPQRPLDAKVSEKIVYLETWGGDARSVLGVLCHV